MSLANCVKISIIGIVIIIAACSTAGRRFDTTLVGDIKKGETSGVKIKEWFGEPLRKEMGPNGDVWHYTYQKSNITPLTICLRPLGMFELDVYSTKLDVVVKEGIVVDYAYDENKRTQKHVQF